MKPNLNFAQKTENRNAHAAFGSFFKHCLPFAKTNFKMNQTLDEDKYKELITQVFSSERGQSLVSDFNKCSQKLSIASSWYSLLTFSLSLLSLPFFDHT